MSFLQTITEIELFFLNTVTALLTSYGGFGVLIGMFLESSIVPIPSEVVLVTAGALGIDLWTITIYGTIGSTLGAIVGYYIGLKGGRPVIDKYGKYLLVTPARVEKAEKKFNEWGKWTILISRLIPFIPYKVFSITSGVLKFDFKNFVVFTFIGSIPRTFLLAWIGAQIMTYRETALIAIAAIALIALWYWVWRKKIVKKNRSTPDEYLEVSQKILAYIQQKEPVYDLASLIKESKLGEETIKLNIVRLHNAGLIEGNLIGSVGTAYFANIFNVRLSYNGIKELKKLMEPYKKDKQNIILFHIGEMNIEFNLTKI